MFSDFDLDTCAAHGYDTPYINERGLQIIRLRIRFQTSKVDGAKKGRVKRKRLK